MILRPLFTSSNIVIITVEQKLLHLLMKILFLITNSPQFKNNLETSIKTRQSVSPKRNHQGYLIQIELFLFK